MDEEPKKKVKWPRVARYIALIIALAHTLHSIIADTISKMFNGGGDCK
jgi:hypothetical protein